MGKGRGSLRGNPTLECSLVHPGTGEGWMEPARAQSRAGLGGHGRCHLLISTC